MRFMTSMPAKKLKNQKCGRRPKHEWCQAIEEKPSIDGRRNATALSNRGHGRQTDGATSLIRQHEDQRQRTLRPLGPGSRCVVAKVRRLASRECADSCVTNLRKRNDGCLVEVAVRFHADNRRSLRRQRADAVADRPLGFFGRAEVSARAGSFLFHVADRSAVKAVAACRYGNRRVVAYLAHAMLALPADGDIDGHGLLGIGDIDACRYIAAGPRHHDARHSPQGKQKHEIDTIHWTIPLLLKATGNKAISSRYATPGLSRGF